MMLVRHASLNDLDTIFELIQQVQSGMTSLPNDIEVLRRRLQRIEDTLHNRIPREDHIYFFVLEDTETGKIAGISAIEVVIGSTEPFYNFKIATQVHSSKELDVYRKFDVLILTNDYTGHSELCSLFLAPNYRVGNNGKLISKARMLFMAAFPECFEPIVIAEMRGYFDENGKSPFWEAFGSKFFEVDFAKADYLTGTGDKAFVAQLMPRFPFYVDFLPEEARQVMGKVHPDTEPALNMLKGEGLKYKNNVDIFDAGPNMEAFVQDLRAVRDSQRMSFVADDSVASDDAVPYLISNDRYHGYRAVVVNLDKTAIDIVHEQVKLPEQVIDALQLQADEKARILTLNPNKPTNQAMNK
ncbi:MULTISPECIES: arginine N-succinyltransferase [unclassified Acinetobacter]|uniref:arginine N-succinyltransferase n=1 Tax=unclassified Acinetobacter TaxID=196816 RepID=UPI0035BA9381